MDSKKNSNRPSSSDKKKMEVINPRQAKPSEPQKSKTFSSRKLEKVSNSSPSTSQTDFSFARPATSISESEKQQLSLLSSDPLSFTQTVTTDRERNLKFIQDTLEAMQLRNQEREDEETYERLVDTLQSSESSERAEKMKRMQEFVEGLKTKKDEDGNNLIEFPEDFDEMVETAVEYQKNNLGADDVNWIKVFESKNQHEAEDEVYRKKRDRIKQLDLILKQKEKALRELRCSRESSRSQQSVAETPKKDSFFLTKVQTKTQPKQFKSNQNFIKKNIEHIEEYNPQSSLVNKLSYKDQQRLLEIENRLESIEEYNGILESDDVKRLEDIDKQLRSYIPSIEWEKKSINSGQYSHHDSENTVERKKVKPGDPVLREAQERRETLQELQGINTRLIAVQTQPIKPMLEEDIHSLLVESGYNFDPPPVYSTRKSAEELLIDEAKACIESIQSLEGLDFDEVLTIAKEAEIILETYSKIAETQDKELEKDPEYLQLKNSLQTTYDKCRLQQKDCESALGQLDALEKKLSAQQGEIEANEKIEAEMLQPIKPPDFPLQSIEEIDQEISNKAEGLFETHECRFDDLSDITPENLPMLYHVFERVLSEPID